VPVGCSWYEDSGRATIHSAAAFANSERLEAWGVAAPNARIALSTALRDRPVIVYPEAFITEEGVFDTYVGMRTWLLGIVWGHADLFQRVLESDRETPHHDKVWVKQNSGLMYVVPSWKLLDMLMMDEEIALRAKRDRDWDEKNTT
jgi:hypothetical protein